MRNAFSLLLNLGYNLTFSKEDDGTILLFVSQTSDGHEMGICSRISRYSDFAEIEGACKSAVMYLIGEE